VLLSNYFEEISVIKNEQLSGYSTSLSRDGKAMWPGRWSSSSTFPILTLIIESDIYPGNILYAVTILPYRCYP
jgi:hypothetical protein